MRKPSFILILAFAICFWTSVASAWEQLDYDIFDLVDDVRRAHGEDATFYSVLDVPETASVADINKAHRKLSRSVHPDKNPSPEAEKVFKRLGAITSMLKDSEKRERYHFFMKNGVPVWRGTGYYYKRHRPGLQGVLVMLALFSSAVHYLLMRVSWWRGNERWKTLQADVKKRKGRAPVAVQGYIVTEEGEWPVAKPTLASVWMIAMPVWLLRLVLGRTNKVEEEQEQEQEASQPVQTSKNKVTSTGDVDNSSSTVVNDESTSRMTTRSRRRKAKQ